MSSWRDCILREFTPKVAHLTLVADPDGLLLEEGILQGVRERGFELIPFEDHIAFRYAYESKFRSRWDRGEYTDLVVVLRSSTSDLGGLPYDLLQAGRKLGFNLGEIFPNLSYPVITSLDRGELDALYEAQKRYAPGQLGDNATKEFVLRHVFEIAPELIKQPSDLLRVLLRRHYRSQRIPSILDDRFISLLRQSTIFDHWPLEALVADRETFFAFLQERWPIFLDREASQSGPELRENTPADAISAPQAVGLTVAGPSVLPFDHDDVRVYIDNLFAEGLLHPVQHDHADVLLKTWVGIGIQTAPREDRARRLGRLLASLEKSIPADGAMHTEWLLFARGWGELSFLLYDSSNAGVENLIEQAVNLQAQVDEQFTTWLIKRFAGLANQPPVPPVLLHHLPRFLARPVEDDPTAKTALIVVDGLAMDQWLVVRDVLTTAQAGLRFREQAIFAWIPTLTSVSRQATFAGKRPDFFPNSIQTTDKEAMLWAQFWADQGLTANEVVYLKGLDDGSLETVSAVLSQPKVRVAGLVVDKVDKIMHGMEMGSTGMHNQVRQWAEGSFLRTLIEMLLNQGFLIFLTSDHGNIEARGCGNPAEGALVDQRGVRVRIYPDVTLRNKVKQRFPDALEWDPVGLPQDYLPLLAPARQAFIPTGQRTVSHGGISIEELIVPLVQIEKRIG